MEPVDENDNFLGHAAHLRAMQMRDDAWMQQREQLRAAAAASLYYDKGQPPLVRPQNVPMSHHSSGLVFQGRSSVVGGTHFNAREQASTRVYQATIPPMESVQTHRNAFNPLMTPVKRGMVAVEVSTDSSNSGMHTNMFREGPITLTPKQQHHYSYKRVRDSGMDPFITDAFSASPSVSTSPRQANSQQAIPPAVASPPSVVHRACELYPQAETIVNSAIRVDPGGVKRRLSTCRVDEQSSKKRKKLQHDYPINIALHHNASLPVIQLLTEAGPDVLMERDGPQESTALSCALVNKRELDVVSLLVEANPDQVRVCDRHSNYPLHTACIHGSCLGIVKLLACAYPSVLRKRNFHGQTPLDIAQWNALCSDDVIDYLQQTSFGSYEEDAIHLDDDIGADEAK